MTATAKKRGRPAIDGTSKKAQVVYLTAEHVAMAKRLGPSVSAGVRAALEIAAAGNPTATGAKPLKNRG